jgi:hypothetical protein
MTRPWLMSTDATLLESFARELDHDRRPDAVIVDWERAGKSTRQEHAHLSVGFEPSMGTDSPDQLRHVRASFDGRLIVRTNPVGPTTADEFTVAKQEGANDVLLPMVRSPHELASALELAGPTIDVGIMVETVDGIRNLDALIALRPSFCFVGLVDLALERTTSNLFAPIVDGLLDDVSTALRNANIPFGFGGLTLPGYGTPIPSELLAGEMSRVGASFGILRRSFLADLSRTDPGDALQAINAMASLLSRRSPENIATDHRALLDALVPAAAR